MERAELERRYIAAAMTPGVGGATLKKLLVEHGDSAGLWDAASPKSAAAAMRRIATHWVNGGAVQAEEIRRRTAGVPARVVLWQDDEYPLALRDVSNPPCVLYVRGQLRRLTPRALAIVGTTEPLPLFARVAGRLARSCAEYGVQIVSGLAKGIDSTALSAAVEHGVPAFAVVGHGIDHEYPATSRPLYAELARTGAIISQFPTGTGPQRWTFPMRNELMCTLAYGTLIVQAHNRDGSRIQADFSFRHGRDVLIYSANADLPDNEWFHDLQGRGALVFSTFDEVMEAVARRHEQFRNIEPANSPAQPEQIGLGLAQGEISSARALLVDVDGVLADTRSVAEASLRTTASELGASLDDARWAGLRMLTPYALATDLGLGWRGFNEAFTARLATALGAHDFVRPEVRDVLSRARTRGWRLAAVTSQPRSRAIATLKASASLFEVLITYNDTVRRTKPDPYPLLLAAERLGVSAENAVAVGDTHVDLLAARRAKMRSIAVLWGYERESELARYSPDHVVASPAELEDLLTRELEPVG